MLFLAAYIFMFRVPSEGLPVIVMSEQELAAHKLRRRTRGGQKWPPVVCVSENQVEWFFWQRKHKYAPSSVYRECWCERCRHTCPVHVLGCFLKQVPVNTQPFVGIHKATHAKYVAG